MKSRVVSLHPARHVNHPSSPTSVLRICKLDFTKVCPCRKSTLAMASGLHVDPQNLSPAGEGGDGRADAIFSASSHFPDSLSR